MGVMYERLVGMVLVLAVCMVGCSDGFSVTWPGDDDDSLQLNYPLEAYEAPVRAEKRNGCNGFPCVFSHLGTKASDATIERIKLSILMDCLNDPHCVTQGRRKRIPPSDIGKSKLLFGKRASGFDDYDWMSLVQALQKRKRK